jgi:hypothetical protein
MKQMAETLFLELDAAREEAIKRIPYITDIRRYNLNRYVLLSMAKRLDSLGVKEIVEIHVEVEVDPEEIGGGGSYLVQIKDEDEKSYYMVLAYEGFILFLHEGDRHGKLLFADV